MNLIKLLLVLLLGISSQALDSQPPPWKHKFSDQIIKEQQEGILKSRNVPTEYALIGAVDKAISSYEYPVELRWGFDSLSNEKLDYFKHFKPRNAIDYIIEKAKDEKIVMINEAHHIPLHRHFTKQLLSGLKKLGFNYIGLEALANCPTLPDEAKIYCDTLLNERGYPIISPFMRGYNREPQMANLIRECHELGIQVFAYEQFGEERELNQAKNIIKIQEQDPDARIIIHCGYAHLIEELDSETRVSDGKLMGFHLKELTGINPFTINQYILTESEPVHEVPLYKIIDEINPKVFVNEQNDLAFNGWKDPPLFDVLVYHPRTSYFYNRPSWLIKEKDTQLILLNKQEINITFPILVRALKSNDSINAVPVDVIEIKSSQDDTALVLKPGIYRLLISNSEDQTQEMILLVE